MVVSIGGCVGTEGVGLVWAVRGSICSKGVSLSSSWAARETQGLEFRHDILESSVDLVEIGGELVDIGGELVDTCFVSG